MASISYAVKNDWGTGFTSNMTVSAGSRALHGWTVEFDAAFDISTIWGAQIVSHVGNHYVLRNLDWNADVAAVSALSFGFQAAPLSGGGTAATGLAISGTNSPPPPVLPTLSIADASIGERNAGTADLSFTVALSQAATGPVTVKYATANGTASAGLDFTARTGTLTFAPGETSKIVKVKVTGDTAVEANETLTVTLSGASGATLARAVATGTIVNDDTAPAPPVGGASVAYNVASNWGAGFTADLKVSSGSTALNGWTVAFDGGFTITSIWNAEIVSHVGTHYVVRNVAWNGQVAAGQQTGFGFQASTGSDGSQATGLSINGTPLPVMPSLSVADATVSEGNSGKANLAFRVTLSAAATSPVTVAYATANGTATAGSDYAAQSGMLTFAAGETSKVVKVKVTGDTAVEANETLALTLSSATGATLARATATGTIANDDAAPAPTLSIGDASFNEGSVAAPGRGTFSVTLSAASATPVTVNFATANGTALAGSDYVARSGTLTFAAGETTKTITVTAIGDAMVEANESFSMVLSNPTGAVLADVTGIGTIINDDTAPVVPSLSIADASAIEGTPGLSAAGWLSTSGNQIVDSAGRSVQIAGVNWFGFESSNLAPHGLWTRGYKDMMQQMVDLGFNTIRLPFSSDMLHATSAPNGIDFSKNADLQGLSALQIMDKIVDYAGQIGLKIILDHHRSDSGAGTSGNGLWYDGSHSAASWVSDWQMLATRYAAKPQVIGADLHNEPYNGTWGGGGANDWARAAETAGNAIGTVNPNWLIFVEGVGTYQGQPYWWGGNLMGVKDRPVVLNVPNKLVYSPHDYPNSVWPQPWFQGADFPANLAAKFDQMWGYIYKQGIAPIYVGEFGTNLTDPKDAPWLKAITQYMAGDLDNNGTRDIAADKKGVSWTFWSWNPNSGDTGGILKDDWSGVNANKMAYLTPIEFHFDNSGGGPAPASHADFLVTLSQPATSAVTVNYATVTGEATAADFTGASGSVTFAPGEQSKTVSIAVTADTQVEGNEHFAVVLTSAQGATIARATATGTILDDDTAVPPPSTPQPTTPPTILATPAAWSSTAIDNTGSTVTEHGVLDMAMAQDADLVAISHASGIQNIPLALLSMWSAASDNGGSAGALDASAGVVQTPAEVAAIFNPYDLNS